MAVGDALAAVRERITNAGGDLARVRIVAVTKALGADAVRAAAAAGIHDVGESYAQELVAKASELGDVEVQWHFIGRVQRNKVKVLAPLVTLWHAIDRAEVGREIATRAPGAAVLVEVNVTGEPSKSGCRPEDAPTLVETLRGMGLDVRGLMTVGPAGNREGARRAFGALRALGEQLSLPELSMGMSDDLEDAVAEGATIVRVGRALFGERPARRAHGL